MTRVSSTLLWIEAVVCFGPLASVLALGVLIFPVWIGMLAAALSATLIGVPVIYDSGVSIWHVLLPMTLVVAGVIGLAGLFRVLLELSQNEHPARPSPGTAIMVLVGLVGLVALNLYDRPSNLAALLVYTLLPGICTLHVLYLARALLVPRRRR